jgi:hypothetical protein
MRAALKSMNNFNIGGKFMSRDFFVFSVFSIKPGVWKDQRKPAFSGTV